MIGIKLKFIAKNCVFIVINLSIIINVANSNAANIVFLLSDILYFSIIIPPITDNILPKKCILFNMHFSFH